MAVQISASTITTYSFPAVILDIGNAAISHFGICLYFHASHLGTHHAGRKMKYPPLRKATVS